MAFLDIMGFGDLMEHNDHEIVLEIYETLLEKVFPELPELIGPQIQKTVNSSIIQDSIILWIDIPSDSFISHASLQLLIGTVQLLLRNGFSSGLPIRGAIAQGRVSVLDKRAPFYSVRTILGIPLLKAYRKEREQNWMGCACDELVIDNLRKDQLQGLESGRYITKYRIPLKRGPVKEEYAVIWHTDRIKKDADKIVREQFSALNKDINSWDVENKILNTLAFIKQVKPVQTTLQRIRF